MGEHADEALNVIMERGWGWRGGNPRENAKRRARKRELSARRIMAHQAFDPIWQSGEMTRSEAYQWLAKEMGLSPERCHMEQMDVAQCDRVMEICNRRAFKDLMK